MGLLSLVGTGAGLLANGVKRLFSGEAKAARQEKRAEKKAAKATKKSGYQTAWEEYQSDLVTAKGGGGIVAQGTATEATDVADTSRRASDDGKGDGKTMDWLKKNWYYVVGGILVANMLGFINLGKKKSVRRRRSPSKPRTVVRYRTRRAPARRKTTRRRR